MCKFAANQFDSMLYTVTYDKMYREVGFNTDTSLPQHQQFTVSSNNNNNNNNNNNRNDNNNNSNRE